MHRALLIGALGLLAIFASRETPRPTHNVKGDPVLPDARLVKALTRPVLSMTVDLYWIRVANLSATARLPWEGKQLIAWADYLTDLEPTFYYAYSVGGLLGTIEEGGTAYNLDEASTLFKKGIANLPDDPRLPVFLAFLQFELQHDQAAAAQTLSKAARIPHAPAYVAQLASRLLAGSGQFEAALAFAESLEQSSDETTREFFSVRVQEIRQEQVLQQIDAAVARFTAARGHAPASLDELLTAKELNALPEDPLGGSFFLTPDGARATSRDSRLKAYQPRP